MKRLLEAALLREKAAEECAAGRKASLALQVLTLHALVYMRISTYTHTCADDELVIPLDVRQAETAAAREHELLRMQDQLARAQRQLGEARRWQVSSRMRTRGQRAKTVTHACALHA